MIHDHAIKTAPESAGLCVHANYYGDNGYRLCGQPAGAHGEVHQKITDHEYQVGSPSMECGFTFGAEQFGSGLRCNRPANQHTKMGRCSHGPRQNCRDIDCQHCIGGGCPLIH